MASLDGLSTDMLRTSRAAWWDDAFTRRLLEAIPSDTASIVDVGCGLAVAAHALLPHLPHARYLGIDADAERIRSARAEAADPRIAFEVARAEQLPIVAATTDVVLFVMTLQHLARVETALAEARRLLRAGGRVVAAEPDNLGQRFYVDGFASRLTEAVQRLCERTRSARLPADIAIGPRVGSEMARAELDVVSATVHAVHSTRVEPAAAFCQRAQRIVHAIARQGELSPDAVEVLACERAIEDELRARDATPVVTSHLVPVFIFAGVRGS